MELNIPKEILEELETKLPQTRYSYEVNMEDLALPEDDIKEETRLRDAGNVVESCSIIDMTFISPIVTMERDDGKKEIVDGTTRATAFKGKKHKISSCVMPNLSRKARIVVNALANTKRNNLSEIEQQAVIVALTDEGLSFGEISSVTGYTEQSVERQHTTATKSSKEVRERIEEGRWSSRKSEEALFDLYKDDTIPEEIKQKIDIAFVDAVNDYNSNRTSDRMEITRDWMASHRTGKLLAKNAHVMYEYYTPEQIARSSIIHSDEFDFICEHPDKVAEVVKLLNKDVYEAYIGLCCEGPFLYDKDGYIVYTPIFVANIYCPAFGVGLFEGAKLDDMVKCNLDYHQGDMFDWLETAEPDDRHGLLFIDSNGTLDFYSRHLIERLRELYPNYDILFLALDVFNNNRNYKNISRDVLTAWGIKTPRNIYDFTMKMTPILGVRPQFIWESSNQSGQKISLWMIKK